MWQRPGWPTFAWDAAGLSGVLAQDEQTAVRTWSLSSRILAERDASSALLDAGPRDFERARRRASTQG